MTESPVDSSNQYRLAIRRPVSTAMLFLMLIVFGWRSYQSLSLTLMPDISYPSLTIRTEYEGAAPEDVEMLVTRPLEELVSIVTGLVEISSVSSAGLSQITLEFGWDTDMRIAQQEVRDRIDLFESPRNLSRKPAILRYNPSLDPVMRVAITSNDPDHAPGSPREQAALTTIRDAAERYLKSDLEAEDGIAQARVKGGNVEEIQVLLDVESIKSLGITPEYIVNSLVQQNINLSGGRLREGETEYLVRTLNEFKTLEEIAQSIITLPGGAQRQLQELAQVFMGARDRETIVHINGREAVAVDIYKEGDANTISVCNTMFDRLNLPRPYSFQESILNKMREAQQGVARSQDKNAASNAKTTSPTKIRSTLPPYAQFTVISDQSRFIRGAIGEVQQAAWIGGGLALLILFLFLQEIKSTVIIGMAIPISVIAAFIPMYFWHISLNIMSLGGLALGVGMLVDNSIIVLESIYRCREEGDEVRPAAERGTREVAGAVTASTLTTICVFVPAIFVEGVAGQLFGDLALTVVFSLLASLLTALYLIPMMAARNMDLGSAQRHGVWIMRSYDERRQGAGRGGMRAIAGIPADGLRYGMRFVLSCGRDMIKTLAAIVKRSKNSGDMFPDTRSGPSAVTMSSGVIGKCVPGILVSLFYWMAAISIFPVLILFLLLRISLAFGVNAFITVLFLSLLPVYSFILLFRKTLSILLYLPLRLYALVYGALSAMYVFLLRHMLRLGPVFLFLMIAAALHAVYIARGLGNELMPPMRQGEFGMRMEIRAGARLQETEERARKFESIIRTCPEVQSVSVEVGRESRNIETERGDNTAEFTVLLRESPEVIRRQEAIMDSLRKQILAAAYDEIITFSQPTLFSFKGEVEVFILGESLEDLRRVGHAALEALAGIEGLDDLEISLKPGYPEVIVEMDRDLMAAYGLSPGTVAVRLRNEIQGELATRFSRGAEKIDIRVRADQTRLRSIADLGNLSVKEGPVPIPLRNVARLREEEGPGEIRRISQRRTVRVSGNVTGRNLGAVSADIDRVLKTIPMPPEMYCLQSGQKRELNTAFESLRFALLMAAFLVFVVMACQFESVVQPALVMCTAPMAFIGVAYALHGTGTHLSVMVFLGGIVLMGIVVNDAIILVDYINQLRVRGFAKKDAIVEAGKARLRPIIMTTATTVLGLFPMLIASGEGAEMRRPMALTLVSGLTSATFLTLLVIPTAYSFFSSRDKT